MACFEGQHKHRWWWWWWCWFLVKTLLFSFAIIKIAFVHVICALVKFTSYLNNYASLLVHLWFPAVQMYHSRRFTPFSVQCMLLLCARSNNYARVSEIFDYNFPTVFFFLRYCCLLACHYCVQYNSYLCRLQRLCAHWQTKDAEKIMLFSHSSLLLSISISLLFFLSIALISVISCVAIQRSLHLLRPIAYNLTLTKSHFDSHQCAVFFFFSIFCSIRLPINRMADICVYFVGSFILLIMTFWAQLFRLL